MIEVMPPLTDLKGNAVRCTTYIHNTFPVGWCLHFITRLESGNNIFKEIRYTYYINLDTKCFWSVSASVGSPSLYLFLFVALLHHSLPPYQPSGGRTIYHYMGLGTYGTYSSVWLGRHCHDNVYTQIRPLRTWSILYSLELLL